MIAGVIARLKPGLETTVALRKEIAARKDFEIGTTPEPHCLPLTIEAGDAQSMETATAWLRSRPEVEFVDVVYVNFEELPTGVIG